MNGLEVLAVLAGGSAVAALFRWLGLPMWSITGGLVGAAAVHLLIGGSAALPAFLSPAAQILVGAAVGASIGPSIFRDFATFLVPGTFAVLFVVGTGLGLGLALHHFGVLPLGEATLGMVPGGVGEMMAAAISLNVDSAVVAGMHLIRLLLVLWTLPLLVRFAEFLGGRWCADG